MKPTNIILYDSPEAAVKETRTYTGYWVTTVAGLLGVVDIIT